MIFSQGIHWKFRAMRDDGSFITAKQHLMELFSLSFSRFLFYLNTILATNCRVDTIYTKLLLEQ